MATLTSVKKKPLRYFAIDGQRDPGLSGIHLISHKFSNKLIKLPQVYRDIQRNRIRLEKYIYIGGNKYSESLAKRLPTPITQQSPSFLSTSIENWRLLRRTGNSMSYTTKGFLK